MEWLFTLAISSINGFQNQRASQVFTLMPSSLVTSNSTTAEGGGETATLLCVLRNAYFVLERDFEEICFYFSCFSTEASFGGSFAGGLACFSHLVGTSLGRYWVVIYLSGMLLMKNTSPPE